MIKSILTQIREQALTMATGVSLGALGLSAVSASGQSCDTLSFVSKSVAGPAGQQDIAVADFNGDGNLDLDLGGAYISFGDGAGGFSATTKIDTGEGGSYFTVGDFNGDGFPDLAFANYHSIAVVLNDGHDNFLPPQIMNSVASPYDILAADLNGDGDIDLAVTDVANNQLAILLGNGMGGFAAPIVFAVTDPARLASGDFNNDGKVDLALSENGGLGIFPGTGDGHFTAGAFYPLGAETGVVAVSDFNRDGKPDLAVSVYNGPYQVSTFLGNGNGTFSAAATISGLFPSAYALTAGDLDGDGIPDLAFGEINAATRPTVTVALGDGTGQFGPVQRFAYPDRQAEAFGIAIADLDGHGNLDIATANHSGKTTGSVFLNLPLASISPRTRPASEDGTAGSFTITRTGCNAAPLTVQYTVGGTATPGVDYRALSGTATIPAGRSSVAIRVTPIDDSIPEGTETVVITLTPEPDYGLAGHVSGTVSIEDND